MMQSNTRGRPKESKLAAVRDSAFLRDQRIDKKLTQGELARRVQRSQQRISQLENPRHSGDSVVDRTTAFAIAYELGINPRILFDGLDAPDAPRRVRREYPRREMGRGPRRTPPVSHGANSAGQRRAS